MAIGRNDNYVQRTFTADTFRKWRKRENSTVGPGFMSWHGDPTFAGLGSPCGPGFMSWHGDPRFARLRTPCGLGFMSWHGDPSFARLRTPRGPGFMSWHGDPSFARLWTPCGLGFMSWHGDPSFFTISESGCRFGRKKNPTKSTSTHSNCTMNSTWFFTHSFWVFNSTMLFGGVNWWHSRTPIRCLPGKRIIVLQYYLN